MQRKILIASVVAPLEAGETIEINIPDQIEVDDPAVVVSRYNQTQVEVLFYERYTVFGVEEDGILEFTPEGTDPDV